MAERKVTAREAIAPGGTIGILGGGQLGRMTALAAAELGYRVIVLCPEADPPAAQVANETIQADYSDRNALDRFAAAVDVVTIEFENIPVSALEHLAARVPVRPGAQVLGVTQDRLLEKRFVRKAGGGTADFAPVDDIAGLRAAIAKIGLPAILKTRRLGYDGKGQARIDDAADAEAAWTALGGAPAILEGFVNFSREASIIVARGTTGETATYVPVENEHRNHILHITRAPGHLTEAQVAEARRIAIALAEGVDLVGLLAVELFCTWEGDVLVNELAPRPHNSGHWTIDGCLVSQFEQLVRAVCGLPLGDPARHSDAIMRNLLGDDIDAWPSLVGEKDTRLHLYGKAEARPGRKMGHVTTVYPKGWLEPD